MSEEKKLHFNLYKFLCFPWGFFVITPVWFGIIKAIEPFMNRLSFTGNDGSTIGVPWWCSWLMFVVGEVAVFLFILLYSYTLPKGKKKGHNIFVLIAPELFQDDKYITSDFIDNFEHHAKNSINGLNIIIPTTLKREAFNQTVNRYRRINKNYWESKRWNNLHKKLKGALYVSGNLKRRSSSGKEKYVFTLTATIGYNNVNTTITPLMIEELDKNFPRQILINKEFEFEEFEAFSKQFATFSEYLIGWAHLVSGNIGIAYRMHYDIFSNNKQSFYKKGALKDLRQLLHVELESIIRECKLYPYGFASTCAETAEKLFPNSDLSTVMVARFLIMTSTDESFDANLARAQSLLNRARINKDNRNTIHANRAYVCLLKGNYTKAESEYRTLFKHKDINLVNNVIEYCNGQILDGCLKERATAYYVKALMLHHTKAQAQERKKAVEEARKHISDNNQYYLDKLSEMTERVEKKRNKSQ